MKKFIASILFALLIFMGTSIAPSSLVYAKNSSVVKTQTTEQTVYVTRTGHKYHQDGCRYLSRSRIPIQRSEAEKEYLPCKVCRP